MSEKKKKSCKKHKKFNYYCPDCRAANKPEEAVEDIKKKVLYPDAIEKGEVREEKFEGREKIVTPYERGPYRKDYGKPPREPRYRYTPIRRRREYKKYLLFLIPVVIVIFLLSIFWFIPSWMAGINLQMQLYSNKAGGLNYVEFFTLNFWSSNFIFNKTALIGAFIGAIIMSIPPERSLFTLLGTQLGWGRTSRIRALVYWWTIGFGVFYLIGQLIDTTSYFGWALYLLQNGIFDEISPTLMIDAFNVILNPTSTDLTSIFLYSALYLPIINFILGLIIFRVILNIIQNTYLRRNDFYVLGDIFLIIGLLLGIAFFSLPTLSLDGLNILQSSSLILSFIVFTILGITIYIYGLLIVRKKEGGFILLSRHQKRLGVLAVVLIIIILIPIFASIPVAYNIESDNYTWTTERWNKKLAREIEWTRICAGLDMIEERPIENYTDSAITPDTQIISLIRQYDQGAAVRIMSAQIASKYETIADSDIIYIGGHEYWFSPKTLRMEGINPGGVELHTSLFDHVEGFLAMDTFSGDLLTTESEYKSVFNVSNNYPIFFGERQSSLLREQQLGLEDSDFFTDLTDGIGAYETDILLNTTWSAGIENLEFSYEGAPDGELSGLEQFWFTTNLGLFPYAVNLTESSYLINRNVKTRVTQALLPGLWIDDDPYLIFDTNLGKAYYGVSICTEIIIGSYSKSPIYRFLGICLVDLLDGEMNFYKNPSLKENIAADPTYPFWKIYMEKYPWQNATTWLIDQLRYPENLFEYQLYYEYYYHVQDATTWRRGDDFHERPTDGNLFYIETDLGEGIEYVGIDLVEYVGREAQILAGLYVIRHGDHFGEAILYQTRSLTNINLIGPATARNYYGTAATQEIELITNHQYGNTLIYPLANSLYYFVPSYATVSALQELKLTGLVNGFSPDEIGYGKTAIQAYEALNISAEEEPSEENVTLSYTYESSANYPNPANSRIELEVIDVNISHPARNIVVNVSIYSDLVNVSLPSGNILVNSTFIWGNNNVGYNYTLINEMFYPGEGKIITAQFYADMSSISVGGIIVEIKYTLIVDGVITYTSPGELISFTKTL